MNDKEEPKGFHQNADAAQAEAIAKMCAAHNISMGAVPNDINLVPAAIASILEQRPRWLQDNSWGQGR